MLTFTTIDQIPQARNIESNPLREYAEKSVNEFVYAKQEAAIVEIPEGYKKEQLRAQLQNAIFKANEKRRVKVLTRKNVVYLVTMKGSEK